MYFRSVLSFTFPLIQFPSLSYSPPKLFVLFCLFFMVFIIPKWTKNLTAGDRILNVNFVLKCVDLFLSEIKFLLVLLWSRTVFASRPFAVTLFPSKGVKTSTCPNAGPSSPPPSPPPARNSQAIHQATRSRRRPLQLLSSSIEILITCEYDCRCRTVGRPWQAAAAEQTVTTLSQTMDNQINDVQHRHCCHGGQQQHHHHHNASDVSIVEKCSSSTANPGDATAADTSDSFDHGANVGSGGGLVGKRPPVFDKVNFLFSIKTQNRLIPSSTWILPTRNSKLTRRTNYVHHELGDD